MPRKVMIPADDVLLCVECRTLYSKAAAEKDERMQSEDWRGRVVAVCPDDGEELVEPRVVGPAKPAPGSAT